MKIVSLVPAKPPVEDDSWLLRWLSEELEAARKARQKPRVGVVLSVNGHRAVHFLNAENLEDMLGILEMGKALVLKD